MSTNPRYPIYIVSKGRWESRLTAKALEAKSIPYRIVIEPQEYSNYAAVIDADKILILPFANLGCGSIPARNWIWDHAEKSGAERHWILDDNIADFMRMHNNRRTPVASGITFRIAEDFADRYTNIALAGMQYTFFVPRKQKTRNPYILNTRCYSCILIRNDIPYRWRGRYNEDTDLSLRVLKDGWCTVLFQAFVCDKKATMVMKGGNTDELYKNDGRKEMALSLFRQHPDVTTIKRKWGRWQHVVDYSGFKNRKLIRKPEYSFAKESNNYGMEFRILDSE